jgi:hypothetical protein
MPPSRLSLICGVALLMSSTAVSCGGGQPVTSKSERSAEVPAGAYFTSTTTDVIPPGQALRGDGDADNPGDIDGNGDSDNAGAGGADVDSDSPTRASYDFPDADDQATFDYGHRPGPAEARAIAGVVKLYYAAAAAEDGQAACKLLLPGIARSAPEDYGQTSTSSGAQVARSCGTVLANVFRSAHGQLGEAITVVKVGIEGATAQVVLSSRAMPASHIFLMRQGGSWRVAAVLGQPLP